MGEPLSQVIMKACEGLASVQEIQHKLNQLQSEGAALNVTWQTIAAFKKTLGNLRTSSELDAELLDILFDVFHYMLTSSCDEDSWSNFSSELSKLPILFLSVLEKTERFEDFFCKLLVILKIICDQKNMEVWTSVSRQILNIFINKKFSLDSYEEALRTYTQILKSVESCDRHNFASKNVELLRNFSYLVQTVGDFDLQSYIFDVTFLHMVDKKSIPDDFFIGKNKNVTDCFRKLSFGNYETDSRYFLNEVNGNLGSRRKVFTVNCNQLRISGKSLKPLECDECIWLDANLESRRLGITFAAGLDSQAHNNDERFVIYIPEGSLKHFEFQRGNASGDDCHFLKMYFKDLKSTHPGLTSNDLGCTILHASNPEKSIEDFINALRSLSFEKNRCGVTEDKLLIEVGANKRYEAQDSDEFLFMPVARQNKVYKPLDFLKDVSSEKKLQDNVISSSNNNHKMVVNALDLFKDDSEEKKKPKKSYGISVGGGGITDPFEISRPSDNSRSTPVNLNRSLQAILSSEESSPRRSSRLKNKTEVNYSVEKRLKDLMQQSPSHEESSSTEKKGRGRPRTSNRNKLFSSQENGVQTFNDGPSPPEKEAPAKPPKKYLESSVSRQRKSKGDVRKSPEKEEIRNTSLLNPNGYAFKRWSGNETSKRGQFWLDKIKKLETEKKTVPDTLAYEFPEEESEYFKNKSAGKKRNSRTANKRTSSVKCAEETPRAPGKETKKNTPKRKTEKKNPPPRPTLKIAKKPVEKKPALKKSKEIPAPETKGKNQTLNTTTDATDIIENTPPDALQEKLAKKLEKTGVSGNVLQKKEPEKVVQQSEPENRKLEKKIESILNAPPNVLQEKACKQSGLENGILPPEPEYFPQEPEQSVFCAPQGPEKTQEEPEPEKAMEEPGPGKTEEERQLDEILGDVEPENIVEERRPENLIPEKTFEEPRHEEIPPVTVSTNRENHEKSVPIEIVNVNDDSLFSEKANLNPAVDPSFGQDQLVQTNPCRGSGNILAERQENQEINEFSAVAARNKENEKAEIPTLTPSRKQNEILNEISNVRAFGKEIGKMKKIPPLIASTKDKENVLPAALRNTIRSRTNSDSSSDKTYPHFSVKSKVNYPIGKRKRLVKRRKSQKRRPPIDKRTSSSDEADAESELSSPKKISNPKSSLRTISAPQKTNKRKHKSSDSESSELALSPEKSPAKSFISALRKINYQKMKAETDRIVQTVNDGTCHVLKAIRKKEDNKEDFSSLVEEMITENSFEEKLEKRRKRVEKCLDYFENECTVSGLCEEMQESFANVKEKIEKGNSSDDKSDAEEGKIRKFSTYLEGVVVTQSEHELKNQLTNLLTKMVESLRNEYTV